jgi:hypothetical protein
VTDEADTDWYTALVARQYAKYSVQMPSDDGSALLPGPEDDIVVLIEAS